jgi:uncharacterized protein (TIGR00255 family)
MIRSMTGFGKATGSAGNNMISVEVKSLNSKFLELNLRLPSVYKDKDLELRNELNKVIERGKVDFIVSIESAPDAQKSAFNKDVIKQYFADFALLKKELKLESQDYLNIIMRLPNVLNVDKSVADPKEWKTIETLTKKALKEFNEFRVKEGKTLQNDFEHRINAIKSALKKIEKVEPERMKAIRTRISKNLEEVVEAAQVRLRSHLDFFIETLRAPDSNGKKLGFILQEIGREINTIGAKANDATMQRLVVEMKDELEKMKEQSANVI